MLSRFSTAPSLFFSALLFSAFGYEFIFFVMTVHVYGLTGNAFVIGIFATLTFVPRLFSSILGAMADRFGKATCLSLSALAVAILLFMMSQTAEIDAIYALWFAASFFLTFIVNTRSTLMAEILAREHYASGNALSLTLLNAAKLLGPLSGGFLSMIVDTPLLLRFASVVYLLTALAAFGIGSPGDGGHKARDADDGLLHTLGKGFGFMHANPAFRQMVAIGFFWRLFLGLQISLFVVYAKEALACDNGQYGIFAAVIGFFWRLFLGLQISLFVVYAKEVLACDNGQYGIFAALIGVGSIAGSLVGPAVSRRMPPSRMIAVGLSLHYGSFILLSVCDDYLAALEIVFLSYLVFYATLVGMHSVRDRMTPAAIRGGAYGTVTAMLTPPAIISMIVGSYLANCFGVATVLAGAGLLALLSLHLVLASSRSAQDQLDRAANHEGAPS